jgi:hypothetical protein
MVHSVGHTLSAPFSIGTGPPSFLSASMNLCTLWSTLRGAYMVWMLQSWREQFSTR